MQKIVALIATLVFIAAGAWFGIAADQTVTKSDDEKSLRAACQSYVKDVNAGDVDSIVSHWTPDAEYVNDTGEKYKGHSALTKLFKENLPSAKGKKFSFETESVRMIAPGVAVEDGEGKLIGDDDDNDYPATRYSAVWVRSGKEWLISSVHDLGDFSASEKEVSPLKQLEWLIGGWHSTDSQADVDMTCAWSLDGKFVKQKYNVTPKQAEKFSVVTLICWDPVAGQLHSWFFDSRGGFGEGLWNREGNSWKIDTNGIVSDARTGSSMNIWKYVDDNTAVWTSKDRELDGVPMPEKEIKFTRTSESDSTKNK